MLENPEILPQIVKDADAHTSEYVSPESAEDLCARTTPYAKKWAPEAARIWLEEHPTGEKIYEDAMSDKDVAYKAKVIAEEDAKNQAITG